MTSQMNTPHQAIRATIAYRGQELRLVDRQVLTMRTPPSHDLQSAERQAGFWFQIEDSNGNSLYRRIMHNPIRFDTETPSEDPERPLMRVPLEEAEGTFFLLIPLLRDAKIVRIFSSPFESGQEAEPARELFSFNLVGEAAPPPSSQGNQSSSQKPEKGESQESGQDENLGT